MQEKCEAMKTRYEALTEMLSDPEILSNQEAFQKLAKEQAQLRDVVEAYEETLSNQAALAEITAMLDEALEPGMREMAEEEKQTLESKAQELDSALKTLLLPKDPSDDKSVILEIRAGTGGDEAALFGGDLLRMYMRYAERHGLKAEYLSTSMTDMGGVKEVVIGLEGRGAYSRLKFESGVHRVQRVPETESQGRIHTSAATVAVLPEAEDVDVTIAPNDLRVDVYRSGGHGGQSVNTTDSAVRITHLPTGLVVICQDEKSQLKNKEKALRVLKSRLLDLYRGEQEAQQASARRAQVGSGDRSERIRTYNFAQNRVTDHRIGMTLYKLDMFLDGDMDEMIEALRLAERAALLAGE